MQFTISATVTATTSTVTTKSRKKLPLLVLQYINEILLTHTWAVTVVAKGYTIHYLSYASKMTPSGLQGRS
jgi:hypothetical protein